MANREYVLGRLQQELRHAEDVHADAYAAELRARMAQLSAGTAANPSSETTGRRPAAARKQRTQ